MTLTPEQRDLARHALGLPNKQRRSYRNHYCGPGGSALDAWEAMVSAGLAKKRAGSMLTGGDDLYHLTRAGAEAALDPRESLCPEDFPSPSGAT